MRQPRQGELARAFRLLGTLGDGARPAPDQVLGLLERLARIVASEFTTLSVCDLAAGRRFLSCSTKGRQAGSPESFSTPGLISIFCLCGNQPGAAVTRRGPPLPNMAPDSGSHQGGAAFQPAPGSIPGLSLSFGVMAGRVSLPCS